MAGNISFKCSNCDKALVDLLLYDPMPDPNKPKRKWVGYAECCYCGNKSFEQEWFGGFAAQGAAKFEGERDNSEYKEEVAISDIVDMPDGTLKFITKKV